MLTSPPVMLTLALAIFVVASLVAWIAVPPIRRRALQGGAVDRPGGRKTQAEPVPYGGGFAVLLGFAAPVVGGTVVIVLDRLGFVPLPSTLAPHARGLGEKLPEVGAILGASLVLLAMGRIDDRRPLSPGLRLLIQLAAATAMTLAGVQGSFFLDSAPAQKAVSVLWIVLVVNACNFIDNMDGLLAGTALAACAGIASLAGASGQLFVAAFALALGGALFGFAVHNKPPARIYIGDEGSMFVGSLLAALVLVCSFSGEGLGDRPHSYPLAVPLLILLVPLADAATVIFDRLRRGVSPMTAGRDHLSHRLAGAGFGNVGATAFLVAISGFANATALFLYAETRVMLGLAVLLLLGATAFLFLALRSRSRRGLAP